MARPRPRIASALLLTGLLAHAATSRADKPVATPTPTALAPKLELEGPEAEAKDRARVLFQQGVAAYRAGKFHDAVEIFLQTQRIYPDTQLSFNVARAYENLGDMAAALRYYRDYLRQADRPSDGDEVRARVQSLEQQLAQRGQQQMTVLSQPEAATVVLDGRPAGITPWTGEVYPGRHRLALELDGYARQEQVVEVDAYAARDVPFVLLPVPPRPAPAPPVVLVKPRRPGVGVGTLTVLGSGLLLLASAVVAEAVSDQSGMSRAGAFLAGGGLGVSSVGGVMLYFDLSSWDPAGKSPSDASPPLRRQDSAVMRD